MFWQKKKIQYKILIPPILKPFEEMNEKETNEFFVWFVDRIPERIEYIKMVCSQSINIPSESIDLSPQSLIYIWKWFLNVAEVENIPNEENTNVYESSEKQFSLETEYILRDIGMYLGQTMVTNISNIKWSYYTTPKTDFFVNRPLLLGFIDKNFSPPFPTEFEPIHMARVQASNIFNNTQDQNDLFNLYTKWMDFKP